MQNFIVLGLVPGTNIQLDFQAWLIISAALLIMTLLFHERHVIRAFMLSHYVAYRIRQLTITRPY